MIERSTRLGDGVVLLIKEIGSDAFALDLVTSQMDNQLGMNIGSVLGSLYGHVKRRIESGRCANDVKGDRSLWPSQQEHPDYYVHIVENALMESWSRASTYNLCALRR